MGQFGQAFLLATLAACGFGGVGIFIHFLSAQGLSPSAMLMGRYLFMVLLLSPLVVRSLRKVPRATLGKILLLGLICTTVQAGCYIVAVEELGPGTAAILIYIYPSMVLLWEWVLFQQPIRWQQVGLIALSWSGSYLVLGAHTFHGTWLGAFAAIVSAILYSLYLSTSHHASRGCSVWLTAWGVALGAWIGSTFTWGIWDRSFPTLSFSLLGLLFGYAVVGTIIPMVALFAAMRRIGAASTSLLCMSEPIFASLVGIWLFHESLRPIQLLGTALIMTASILLSRQKSQLPNLATA